MYRAIKSTLLRRDGPSYTSLNAASCRASTVRRARSRLSVSTRAILVPPRLPSYVERTSKCARTHYYRRTHARTVRERSGFIHKVTRFARKRLRARVNERNASSAASSRLPIPTYPSSLREDVNTRLQNERTSARRGCAAPGGSNKSVAVNALVREKPTTTLPAALCKPAIPPDRSSRRGDV